MSTYLRTGVIKFKIELSSINRHALSVNAFCKGKNRSHQTQKRFQPIPRMFCTLLQTKCTLINNMKKCNLKTISHIPDDDAYSPMNRLVKNRTISAVDVKSTKDETYKTHTYAHIQYVCVCLYIYMYIKNILHIFVKKF